MTKFTTKTAKENGAKGGSKRWANVPKKKRKEIMAQLQAKRWGK